MTGSWIGSLGTAVEAAEHLWYRLYSYRTRLLRARDGAQGACRGMWGLKVTAPSLDCSYNFLATFAPSALHDGAAR